MTVPSATSAGDERTIDGRADGDSTRDVLVTVGVALVTVVVSSGTALAALAGAFGVVWLAG